MRFIGSVFRTLDPRWAWAPLSAEGASMYGGRFNPIGLPALYTSLSYEGAMRERVGLTRTQPVITCEYEVDIEPIFNTFNEDDLEAFQFNEIDLACAWEDDILCGKIPKSHIVAARLIDAGYAGMLVKSFALGASSEDVNLVLWKYGDEIPRKISVVDDEQVLEKMRRVLEAGVYGSSRPK